jgi:hypothetical protein
LTLPEHWSSLMVSAQQFHVILHFLSNIRWFIFWEVLNHHDISGIRQLDQMLAYRTKIFLFVAIYVIWTVNRFILMNVSEVKEIFINIPDFLFFQIQFYSLLECAQNTQNLKIGFNTVVFYDYFSFIKYIHSTYLVAVWILMWVVTYKIYIAKVITVMRIIWGFVSSSY